MIAVGWFRRKTIPGNARTVAAVYAVPDRFSVQAASLGMVTNTFSAASAGIHQPGASARGFVGDRGYGVNRWAGATDYPFQTFGQAIVPVADPSARRLGIGALPSGQPGLPSTGQDASGMASVARMSFGPYGSAGMGG